MRIHVVPASLLVALALGLSACSGDTEEEDPKAADGVLTVAEAGDECEHGGLLVTLTTDSGSTSQAICDGEPGVDGAEGPDGNDGPRGTNALIETESLPVGDADCPDGGTRVTAGLDNGDGGGTANDGILQPGEVDDSETVCSGPQVAPLMAPASPAGAFTMNFAGGTADGSASTDCGGDAGGVSVHGSLMGQHMAIASTGVADASFTTPSYIANLGSNPVQVSANATVLSLADTNCDTVPDTAPADGALYVVACGGALADVYEWNDSQAVGELVTGLHVHPSVTLHIEERIDMAELRLSHDLWNEGILTADPGTNNRIELQVDKYIGAAGSRVDASTGTSDGPVFLVNASLVINHGTIDVDAPVPGGAGGWVSLTGGSGLWNEGDITASGADSTVGAGGDGGAIQLNGGNIGAHNSGALTATGGDGLWSGGNIGTVQLRGAGAWNTGALTMTGGDADSTCPNTEACTGGGPGVETGFAAFYNANGFFNTGDIEVSGGSGPAAGGDGDLIQITAESGNQARVGPLHMSGTLTAMGGNGETAGDGGELDLILDEHTIHTNAWLLGYTQISAPGGDGVMCGGQGGWLNIDNDCPVSSAPAGGAALWTDVDIPGGDGIDGGAGGLLEVFACDGTLGPGSTAGARAIVTGTHDVSAGAGTTAGTGGDGGYAYITGEGGVDVDATFTALGGAHGGLGGEVGLKSHGHVTFAGSSTVSGGDAIAASGGDGGDGGYVYAEGATVDSSADITAVGGAGDTTGANGDGGGADLFGFAAPTVLTGTVDVSAGTGGATAGADGEFVVDGVLQ